MAKKNTAFFCSDCGHESAKWAGQCPGCKAWNTFSEASFSQQDKRLQYSSAMGAVKGKNYSGHLKATAKKLNEVLVDDKTTRITSGLHEFDRVLGGGAVVGSLVLIGGEPGIGKSTLLLQVLGAIEKKHDLKILYVSGEESESQVAQRAKRLGINSQQFYVLHQNQWQEIQQVIHELSPDILVIDSIQTTMSLDHASAPGTASQIREVTFEILSCAKPLEITTFIIGHITKDGQIAGPKMLEHMVDAVIYFEGDHQGHYRLLRAMKNRFGNIYEVGIFEMLEEGLREITNPSEFFVDESLEQSFGRSLTCILEGTRGLFVEIQGLVVENHYGNGRRTTQGIDSNRVAMLIAVCEKYLTLPMGLNDIYVNVVGGLKLQGRETDLAVAVALLSSYLRKSLPNKTVFLGEIGLTGEIRGVQNIEMRLKEMKQLGYTTLITSEKTKQIIKNQHSINILGISKIQQLYDYISKL